MKVIALRPSKQNTYRLLLLSLLLCMAAVLVRWLFIPAAFLLPLVCCPVLPGLKKPWVLCPLCSAAVFAGGCISTGNMLLALSFATLPFLCGIMTMAFCGQKQTLSIRAFYLYFFVYLFAELLMLVALFAQYPGGIIPGLAEELCIALKNQPNRDVMLYQLAFQGVLPKPEGFPKEAGFLLNVDPGVAHQLFLSAKSQLLTGVRYWLPLLMIKGGIVFSLFTFLRVRWSLSSFIVVEEQKEKVTIARPPVFSMLRLGWSSKTLLLVTMLLGMLLSGTGVTGLMGDLIYHASVTVLSLMGAGLLLRITAQGKDRPGTAAGVLVAVLWLIAEWCMILILFFEPVFQKLIPQKPQDDKEEKQQ